jgi:Tfp pilus assembly protein PilN
MRPVNLIPADARHTDRTPTRSGGISYALMALLGVALLGVIALALTSKQISDRQAESNQLNQELTTTTAKAQSLNAFTEFAATEQLRAGTISSLAQSRFDWERVVNELALVIPDDVWLTQLAGTVTPDVQIEDSPDVALRDTVTGPALEIVGCASGQDAVAGFVADLEDIDGVTRVGLATSKRPDEDPKASAAGTGASGAASGGAAGATGGECRTKDFISRFELVVAFDEVPVPGTATSTPGVPAPLASGTAPGSADVGEVQAQQAANTAEVAKASGKAQKATDVLPGG